MQPICQGSEAHAGCERTSIGGVQAAIPVVRLLSYCHLDPLSSGPVLQEAKRLSGSRTIRPTTSLNYGAPLRIDLNGQHVANLFTPQEPE
jgi:hypothetical protein